MNFTRGLEIRVLRQKYELRIADPHPIAMVQFPSFDWHFVDKGAVQAVEVLKEKLIGFSFDLGMTARDRGVCDAESRSRFAANYDRQSFYAKDAAL